MNQSEKFYRAAVECVAQGGSVAGDLNQFLAECGHTAAQFERDVAAHRTKIEAGTAPGSRPIRGIPPAQSANAQLIQAKAARAGQFSAQASGLEKGTILMEPAYSGAPLWLVGWDYPCVVDVETVRAVAPLIPAAHWTRPDRGGRFGPNRCRDPGWNRQRPRQSHQPRITKSPRRPKHGVQRPSVSGQHRRGPAA